MNLSLDKNLADGYTSQSQKIRVLTEHWVGNKIFCPNCGHLDIEKYGNNKPVADFFCLNCKEDYELKSKKENIGNKIVDGAYRTMIERLGRKEFFLDEIYTFENILSKKHTENKHIKEKIRQQLQVLRDKNYLQFLGRGKYAIR